MSTQKPGQPVKCVVRAQDHAASSGSRRIQRSREIKSFTKLAPKKENNLLVFRAADEALNLYLTPILDFEFLIK